jgi:predicted DNA-binding mobile mystery protein A
MPQNSRNKRLANLQLRQIDRRAGSLRQFAATQRPPGGWLHAIRTALGMPMSYLAAQLGQSRQATQTLEQREVEDRITLGALRRAAEALHCDLVYALIPRQPLAEMLAQHARETAEREIRPVAHSMRLEAQGVAESETEAQIKDRTAEILASWPKGFWEPHAS